MSTERTTGHAAPAEGVARPPAVGTIALARLLARSWSLPPRRNRVTVARDLRTPMADGTVLLADHYIPVTGAPAATVLVRTPYGRVGPQGGLTGVLIAERGYHVLIQSCRGTFGSGGAFEPMRNEIADGQDTVRWLREQEWFDGRLATYGLSYLGFVQWALAMDPPPELRAAIVQVGPHDFSRAAYHNGAFDLHNFLGWSNMVAHQEDTGQVRGMLRMATAERKLRPALNHLPLRVGARELLADRALWFEGWLEHPDLSDDFWQPLRCRAALDRITVPTLLVGGWQDLFIEQTLEQYRVLAGRGVPTRLLVGPWAHLDVAVRGGAAVVESLAWLDRYAGPAAEPAAEPAAAGPVRLFVGGAGEWREYQDWPPPGTQRQRWHLGPAGTLTPGEVAAAEPASFRYDPADPTPSVGGAVMTRTAGVRDNRPVEARGDVLLFTSAPLERPVEIAGEVTAEVALTRDNPHADLFVRLCDVDGRGRSRNVCDGIVRLAGSDPLTGTARVSLIGVAHRFMAGHRVRLQVAGGAHPRFARNPGNGGVDAARSDLVATGYHVGIGGPDGSAVVLPVVSGGEF